MSEQTRTERMIDRQSLGDERVLRARNAERSPFLPKTLVRSLMIRSPPPMQTLPYHF